MLLISVIIFFSKKKIAQEIGHFECYVNFSRGSLITLRLITTALFATDTSHALSYCVDFSSNQIMLSFLSNQLQCVIRFLKNSYQILLVIYNKDAKEFVFLAILIFENCLSLIHTTITLNVMVG